MAFSHIVGGMTFTDASFQGNAYADEATGFPKALEKMVEHVANAYHGASTDPLTVGAGSKALTISNTNGQIPAFAIGMPVRIARTTDPAGVWMQGEIIAWDGGTGVATINIDANKGSGSFSDWSIVIGGHLTIASGASPLAVSQGGTGASSGKAALANLTPSVAGIIETNANFVDAVIFGPALDPVDWSPRTAAPTSSLMLATVEDGGADAEVNIWDLTDDNLAGATPLTTVAITGAATPTSISAAMGYIIVGSEDGITIIDPHDGSWAERTVGWPRSLSTSGAPVLSDNDVQDVAAGFCATSVYDPFSGGPLPVFAVAYGTGTDVGSVIKYDGNIYDWAGTPSASPQCIITSGGVVGLTKNGGIMEMSQVPISNITADDFGTWAPYTDTFEVMAGWDEQNGLMTGGDSSFFHQMLLGVRGATDNSGQAEEVASAKTDRTFTSGYMLGNIKSAILANSKTADRSYNARDLAETGTVTEAAAETGSEIKAYSDFSAVDYLEDAYDAAYDFATGMCVMVWVKVLNNTDEQRIFHRDDPADVVVPYYGMSIHSATGKVQFHYYTTASSTGNNVASLGAADDGQWHFAVGVHDQPNGEFRIYLDGQLGTTATHGGTGSLANTSAVLRVGDHPQAAQTFPMDEGEISLLRFSASIPTEAQIRAIYEAERPIFAANAKCLLQSGTTDAVLDTSVDPITGKVAVTQADSAMIFRGLLVESETTLASGGTTWEHNKLYGDDLVQINDANLYAAIGAKDLRQDLETLRGLKAGLPRGIDLSKAKAWVIYDQTGTPSIEASYNVSSVEDLATGQFIVNFGVPFKHRPSATWSSDRNGDGVMNIDGNADRWGTSSVRFTHFHNTSGAGQDAVYSIVFFGELENE